MRQRRYSALLSPLATVLAACSSTIAPSDAGDAVPDRAVDSAHADVTDIEFDDAGDGASDAGCRDANMCPAPANGSATCESGVCGIRCNAGFHGCGGICASDVDVASCGASCVACAVPPHASASCDHGACAFVCNTDFHLCGSDCVSNGDVATCGTSCTPCTAPSNAVPSCDGSVCDFTCSPGYERIGDACVPIPPRPIAPLSTAIVTSRQPTLRWSLAPGTDGARVDVCRDRACTSLIASFDAVGSSIVPDADLPAGVVYWRLRGRVGSAMGTRYGPTWQFTVGTRSASHDASWGSVPDVNGDGFADVIVGGYVEPTGSGGVYVYAGSTSGIMNAPTASLASPSSGRGFGESVASAGDVDGDGFGDVIVGETARSTAPGLVHVFRGGASGLDVTRVVSISDVAELFGHSVASAGDINGDGYSDVIVGAPGSDAAPGHAYVSLGSAAGIASVPTMVSSPAGSTSAFGVSVAGAGDVDGDGFADVIVGDPNAWRAYVYRGGATGLTAPPTSILMESMGTTQAFGVSVDCAGDVNADGFADVIVGAYDTNGGRAYVFLGSAAGLVPSPATVLSPPAGASDLFGTTVAGAGDLNGDGFGDAIVGGYGSGSEIQTAVHVYFGSAGGLVLEPAVSIAPPDAAAAWFGHSVAGAGDTDGDGLADFVVGTIANSRAYLFDGAASNVSAVPTLTLTGPFGFGYSVATRLRIEGLRNPHAFAARVPNRTHNPFRSSSSTSS